MSDTLLDAGGGTFTLTGGTVVLDTGLTAGGGTFVLTGGAVTAPVRPSKDKPFIERVPEAAAIDNRLRRFTEKISVCMNSLFGNSYIVQEGQAKYTIRAGAWSAARAPTAQDDLSTGVQPGNAWVDTNAGTIYFCVDNSGFAAIWKGPY